jgi:hypothetical protein
MHAKQIQWSDHRSHRTIHDDFEPIEGYVVATSVRYERVLIATIPTLDEPRVADPDLALKRLRFLIETLAGFAVGVAVGAVGRAVRYGFGEEVRGRVSLLLGRIARDGSLTVAVREPASPARFLRDLDRPLLDALGSRLLTRLYQSISEMRTHVSAIHAEITRAAPARLPELAGVLDRLAADDAPAFAFSDRLVLGWQHYAAAVSDRQLVRPPEAKEEENDKELWRVWTRRLRGRAAPDAPTRNQVMAQGFLLQIT